MDTAIKERILSDLEKVPDDRIPKVLRTLHELVLTLSASPAKPIDEPELAGLWKGAQIEEDLLEAAKAAVLCGKLS